MIDLTPDYQRGNVWSDYQKVDLIDSIFNEIDIGKLLSLNIRYPREVNLYMKCLMVNRGLLQHINF